MTDPLARPEGCDSEHPRFCPPPELVRGIGSRLPDDRNPARDWVRPSAWVDLARFLFTPHYRPTTRK